MYESVAIIIMIALYLWAVLVTTPLAFNQLTPYAVIFFIIAAQLLGIVFVYDRDKTEKQEYEQRRQNEVLTSNLKREIYEKNEAQRFAQEAENKRTQFTSYIFHEIRVPLNAVILSNNLLENDTDFQSKLSEESLINIARIKQGLSTIENVINDTLDYRKMNEGKLIINVQPFDFFAMIDNVIWAMEANWIKKNNSFKKEIENTDMIVYKLLGDETRLRQVVANFLSNATKFTSNGTIICRTIFSIEKDKSVTIVVEVSDTGIGIREDDQKKLFHPFVQIDPDKTQGGKGTGLGLSICASILDSIGGTYGVKSVYGKGSTFWFKVKLRISDEPRHIQLSKPVQKEVVRNFRLNILVTDDDSTTRDIMVAILHKLGHSAHSAVDGIDCLEKIQSADLEGRPFDVLFIDNQMPRLDGKETIIELRKRGFIAPIVSLTGSSNVEITDSLLQAGSNKILIKPSSIDSIDKTLRMLPITAA